MNSGILKSSEGLHILCKAAGAETGVLVAFVWCMLGWVGKNEMSLENVLTICSYGKAKMKKERGRMLSPNLKVTAMWGFAV